MTDTVAPTGTFAPRPAPTFDATTPVRAPRLRQTVIGLSAITGGLLTLTGFLATPWEGSDAGLAGYLHSLTAAPDQALWAAILLHFGYMGFLPMFLALAVMTRARWRITGTIGVAAGMLTAVGFPGLLVTDFYDLALGQTLPIDQAVAASARAQEPWMAALLNLPSVFGMVIGMAVAGFAAWRAGFLPWIVPLVGVAGFFAGSVPTVWGGAIAGGAMMLMMVAVGVRTLRMTPEQWRSGRRDG